MSAETKEAATHAAEIAYQFTAQAADFAAAVELHNKAELAALVAAAAPRSSDISLDVACGPGSIVMAFARTVKQAHGFDATPAMLDQARALADREKATNIVWHSGNAEALPFADGMFDIVTCRFAFHHFMSPARVFAEMVRVCRPSGQILVCDGFASDDPAKAQAFNEMERFRDPSTVEFRTLGMLKSLFAARDLPAPTETYYRVPYEAADFVARSFPANNDRPGLLALIEAAVDGDKLGMGAHREGSQVFIAFNAVILATVKPAV